ncbi:MAG: Gfo/Idh/MocA family oxidoreductase [Bryobacterales bacterium]|nr:Gfo/Idh/MocA family oxidoreductase [Bryobacterales bacterium]
MNRRFFVKGISGAALASRAVAAGDRLNVAVIGIRGRGRSIAASLAGMPEANITALCDVDENVYPRAAKAVEERSGGRPPFVKDMRRILDDRSVDAVFIATPDHWHAPATLLACDAGKDVYVEKPASHNLREGRLMVEAARRHQRVVQVGTQSRSRPSTLRAIGHVHAGRIGRVLMAKAWNVQLRENIGHKNDSAVPAGVDFEMWTGPAPFLPFNENRFHYTWHWNWNYGTGDMGNDGVHQMDIARWALGVGAPRRVSGMGRKLFFDDDQQTPDTMNITFEFEEGKALLFEMRIWNPYGLEGQDNGVAVYGTEGSVQIGRWAKQSWGFRIYDRSGKLAHDETDGQDGPELHHFRNFLASVRDRRRPHADIETGHQSTMLCHLGNIVARTGRNVRFDGVKEAIEGDHEVNGLLRREYRPHWAAPRGV